MNIRLLTEADAEAFQDIRLRALLDHPEAFGSDYSEEKDTPIEKIREMLRDYLPDKVHLGAFEGDQLVGITSVFRYTPKKSRHRAILTRMYTAPEVRGRGVGRALLQQAIEFSRQMDGLEILTLAVTVGNPAARKIYMDAGFQPAYIEERYLKIGDAYYDIEWMTLPMR